MYIFFKNAILHDKKSSPSVRFTSLGDFDIGLIAIFVIPTKVTLFLKVNYLKFAGSKASLC